MSYIVKSPQTNTQDIHITSTKRKSLITTSNSFEHKFGYHRAVRRGPVIAVSGTTSLKVHTHTSESEALTEAKGKTESGRGSDSTVQHPNDPFNQALLSLNRAIEAVARLGGQTEDIIRVRMFVARAEDCEAVGAAFRQCFRMDQDGKGSVVTDGGIDVVGAAATMIVVPGGFVDGGMLVEVEVDAYVL